MAIFKHILVATDFGDSSTQALQLAVELAGKLGAELTLAHIWEFPSYGYMEAVPLPVDLGQQIEKAAEARMKAMIASIKDRCPNTKSIVKMGLVGPDLLELVEKLRPDLVVTGTHGRRGLKRAVLGSVAEKLVRTSPVPVLTVHGKEP